MDYYTLFRVGTLTDLSASIFVTSSPPGDNKHEDESPLVRLLQVYSGFKIMAVTMALKNVWTQTINYPYIHTFAALSLAENWGNV